MNDDIIVHEIASHLPLNNSLNSLIETNVKSIYQKSALEHQHRALARLFTAYNHYNDKEINLSSETQNLIYEMTLTYMNHINIDLDFILKRINGLAKFNLEKNYIHHILSLALSKISIPLIFNMRYIALIRWIYLYECKADALIVTLIIQLYKNVILAKQYRYDYLYILFYIDLIEPKELLMIKSIIGRALTQIAYFPEEVENFPLKELILKYYGEKSKLLEKYENILEMKKNKKGEEIIDKNIEIDEKNASVNENSEHDSLVVENLENDSSNDKNSSNEQNDQQISLNDKNSSSLTSPSSPQLSPPPFVPLIPYSTFDDIQTQSHKNILNLQKRFLELQVPFQVDLSILNNKIICYNAFLIDQPFKTTLNILRLIKIIDPVYYPWLLSKLKFTQNVKFFDQLIEHFLQINYYNEIVYHTFLRRFFISILRIKNFKRHHFITVQNYFVYLNRFHKLNEEEIKNILINNCMEEIDILIEVLFYLKLEIVEVIFQHIIALYFNYKGKELNRNYLMKLLRKYEVEF